MTTSPTVVLFRRSLQKLQQQQRYYRSPRSFSSQAILHNNNEKNNKPFYWDNPGALVEGVTTSDLESNEKIAAYFEANFYEEDYYATPLVAGRNTPPPEPAYLPKDDPGVPPLESPLAKRNIRMLPTVIRDREREEGTASCRNLRSQRLVPGLLYGPSFKNEKMSDGGMQERVFVKTPEKALQREVDKFGWEFRYKPYLLQVKESEDSEEVREEVLVTMTDVNLHPVRSYFYCVNYLRYYPERPIRVPLKFINEEESPVLKRGGFIIPLQRDLNVIVDQNTPIPDYLQVDCTGLKRKQVITLDRIIFPPGVTVSPYVKQDRFLAGTTRGKRSANKDED